MPFHSPDRLMGRQIDSWSTVTLADLCQMLDASENYARYMAHRLVKKGWFERLRPGLFQLIPADRGREGVADTHPLTVGAKLVSPYFYSFGTACTHHGLTDQVFTEVYLASQQRRQPVDPARASPKMGYLWKTHPSMERD